jgi:glycosyltransferase involved in cell wall biosynthesis
MLIKPIYRSIERRYLNSVDGFIYNSLTTQKVVAARLGRARPGIVAQPGGDHLAPKISSAQIRRRARQLGSLRVLFLGNLIRRKAPHLLLEAAAALSRGSLQLTIAGGAQSEPAYARSLKALAKQYGLVGWVEFCGHLQVKELRARLRASQVLVVPSSYEGFGIAYLEGMGFGLPAIGARAGAAAQLIRHGRTGYLIAVGDSRQLAKHLNRLHRDRAMLARLCLAARRLWSQQPTWKQSLARIENFLSSYNRAEPRSVPSRRKK